MLIFFIIIKNILEKTVKFKLFNIFFRNVALSCNSGYNEFGIVESYFINEKPHIGC